MKLVANNKIPDFKEDLVVFPGVGYREFNYNDILHIRIKDDIMKKIKIMIGFLGIPIVSNNYNIIHLRGGDHPQSNEITPENYVNLLYQKYLELNKEDLSLPLILITDTLELVKLWKKNINKGICFNDIVENNGLHKLDKENIPNGLTKVDLNIQMLRDFVLMVNAKNIIADGRSVFSKMAIGIKKNNTIQKWASLD
jgi:hypothetical protein